MCYFCFATFSEHGNSGDISFAHTAKTELVHFIALADAICIEKVSFNKAEARRLKSSLFQTDVSGSNVVGFSFVLIGRTFISVFI